jgi:hypothetical protein
MSLRSAGVAKSGCALVVVVSTHTGNAIRSSVLANYATSYGPEQILEVPGLRRQLVLRWQREEQESALSITTGKSR